jgi:hypothetical protein
MGLSIRRFSLMRGQDQRAVDTRYLVEEGLMPAKKDIYATYLFFNTFKDFCRNLC